MICVLLNSPRFFLSFYGHKLPVLALDTSDDTELMVTGMNDRFVMIVLRPELKCAHIPCLQVPETRM
jgi:hypothetical protein